MYDNIIKYEKNVEKRIVLGTNFLANAVHSLVKKKKLFLKLDFRLCLSEHQIMSFRTAASAGKKGQCTKLRRFVEVSEENSL